MKGIALALALLLAGCAAPTPSSPSPSPTPSPAAEAGWQWTERAAAPIILAETAVAQDGAQITIVGGWTQAGGGSPLVVRYDAMNDTWSQLPPYPLPIHHAQAAALDGVVYVFGGAATGALLPGTVVGTYPKGWPIVAHSFRLDAGASTWTPIAPLPEARGLGGAAVVDGKIVLVGGTTMGGEYLARVDVYDPATDSYASAADLPTLRDHLSVVADGGRVYALAGRSNAGGAWDDLEASEALDVANDTWSALAPAPLGRGGQAAGVLAGGLVALVGGERAEGEFDVYDAAHAFDPAAGEWVELPPLPEGRHGMAAAAWDGSLFLMGGATLAGDILTSTLVLERASDAPQTS